MAKKKKKRRSSYSKMTEPIIDVMAIGITSGAIGAAGATGSTATVLNTVPTVMAAGTLKKYSKKWW